MGQLCYAVYLERFSNRVINYSTSAENRLIIQGSFYMSNIHVLSYLLYVSWIDFKLIYQSWIFNLFFDFNSNGTTDFISTHNLYRFML